MEIERPWLGGCVFVVVRPSVVRRTSYVRRGDRFFPGTLFQDRHRRPNGWRAGTKYKQIDLEHFLENYDLNIEDLMTS